MTETQKQQMLKMFSEFLEHSEIRINSFRPMRVLPGRHERFDHYEPGETTYFFAVSGPITSLETSILRKLGEAITK